ncbi:flocculation protein FLO11-like [Numida meleagris]|uniref:flocculation protein FLO11-like n=1 Tax=Numida meleagris TaxID=8996 RepID=UPI000B3D8569|nr:flocculation protein FLO11-like [Numida meleagris]XP_021249473.1 flocculation protein FLO11-like [Numida meleagris]XP_021249474.1 flocculation protein FLO11-like [Numida meleagris]
MSTWTPPLLWSLTTACLTGIALGQTATTQAPVASTPLLLSATTTQVPVAPTPMSSSASATSAPTSPSAVGTLSAGTVTNLTTPTVVPSAVPSTNPPAPALPTTPQITMLTSGIATTAHGPTAPMATSHSAWVTSPDMTASPGVPSVVPSLTTTEPSNCSRVNVTACAPCSPGTVPSNDTWSCSCCAEGSCMDPGACAPCPAGHYQPARGQQQCLPCPKGRYANTTRSTACSPCPPGHYANESGATACSACQEGYFSSHQNAAFCLPCLPGSFCNTSSCTVCLACPAGREAPREAAEECMLCGAGMFKGPGDDACKPCEPGEYQLQRGQESCDPCPENHYCPSPDVNPIKCPPDAFCPAGSTAPQYCMEIFLYKVGSSCQLTPLVIIFLALFSAGAILIIFVLILRRRQDYSTRSLKSLLLPRGSGRHTTYGVMEHTEPVYAGW